jgi:SAM-dependent methyltransferase
VNVSGGYEQAWESFWQDAPYEAGGVFWDADPALTAERHLPHFREYFDPGLPVVDLGCGNGTQTRFLAGRYERVIGVDLARAAIGRAVRDDPRGVAEYQRLDAVEAGAVRRLHEEIGDANVYMRGVLHQCEAEDRGPLADGIAVLVGQRGRAFVVELAEAAKPVLMALAQGPAGPPRKLGEIFAHGIAPGEMSDAALPEFFRDRGLDVLSAGEQPLITTESAADGTWIEIPSKWLVVGRTG